MMKTTICAATLAGSLLASVSASSAAEQTTENGRMGTFDLKDFGAACDGRHDDTKAIQAWLDRLKENVRLTAPAGVCVFSAPLRAPHANDWTIEGSGPYSTDFEYAGPSSDNDLLTISDTAHGGFHGGLLADFRISSRTRMTSGAALHIHGSFTSMYRNLIMDGHNGNGNLNDGYWFDGVGFSTLIGFEGKGQGDGIRVNYSLGGAADLYLFSGRIGDFAVGLHVAGGVGGIQCDQTDFLRNGIGLKVDNSEVQKPNREVKQGLGCAFDSATSGDNVLIDDTLASGGTIRLSGWIASSFHGSGVRIAHWRNGDVEMTGDKIYNNCLDGVYIEDPTTHVLIADTVAINHNGNARVGHGACGSVPAGRGWGVNALVPTENIVNDAVPWDNLAGAFSSNTGQTAGPRKGLKN